MLSALRIKTRLYAGFLVILLLLVVLAGASWLVFGNTARGFQSFAGSASLAVTSVQFDRQVQDLDRKVADTLRAPDDAGLAAVAAGRKALEATLAEFQAATRGQPIATHVDTIATAVKAYGAALDPALNLASERVMMITATLNPTAAALVEAAAEVRADAAARGDAAATEAAGKLVQHMLQAELAVNDYLLTRAEDSFSRAWEELFLVDEAIAELTDADTAHDYYQIYQDGLNALSGIIGEVWAREGELAKQGAIIAAASVAAKDMAVTEEARIQRDTDAQLGSAKTLVVALAVLSVILGAIAAFVIGQGIAGPVIAMTEAMRRLAGGDKAVAIPATERRDEIGEMAAAVQVFKDNALEMDRLEAERAAAEAAAQQGRRQAILALADELEKSVAGVVGAISGSATDMQTAAEAMSATAQDTSRQATTVASATLQANTNVEIAAAATEELSASIREISSQVAQSADIARQAVDRAHAANTQVTSLLEATARIGEVVQMITAVAEQTNLLALNATIEAARAGDAGKGFAVVASEVKNLANQTSRATDDIGRQIAAVQTATEEAVDAIRGIVGVIDRMSEISSAISAAVEEQGAATEEIARNAQQAALGTHEITQTIDAVSEAATETGSAAQKVLSEANDLLGQAGDLSSAVDRFLNRVRHESAA
ncbi:methyl-accepting chemotaxis protein [Novispirillum sp. DQ9]|uniref:methyl-accepting chemotaxis protein n=1 Tax=Novispirillum sp. DQ9 TaxID=3398612 RepID=UPI003C7C7335